ncbi:hypothetical protein LCGC14_0759010 [marine sediment metagenome]|uniref:Uncharacterized protein n=1 Tax=marine sediment metagenome TaxID=412755 RepID=A0A0F9QLN5_9ZZZZ
MIKGIDNKKVDINEIEYKYYQELVKKHGVSSFSDLFETNEEGCITIVKPTKSISWDVIFFVQNLMINQHMRSNDKRISAIEKEMGEK